MYIGQTTMTVYERFMAHMKPSVHKKKSTYKIYNAINKYGAENFYVETLEDNIPIEELDEKEIEYITKFDSYNSGYNSTPGGDGRIINKLNNEEELLSFAQSGVCAKELAEIFDVSVATILRTLHKLGFYYRVDQDEIMKLVDGGYSNQEISDMLGCHKYTVSRTLKKHSKPRRKKRLDKREDFDFESMFNDYAEQIPIDELCKKYDITKSTFARARHKYGIPTRKQVYKKKNNAYQEV